ncbi:hypothetical protein CkaCkLH20_12591 [Colletotrichum karsti]|uniref:Uncharacterized protein n=1 Tax=Colletotrichum karsti TaxID=1095194 RepID=A0A9P6HSI8_9PEZI|nr:uncharacterized protein CkaCkLH20_12591 [Colletotrichum karsti]KAF9869982.1 hypothetical protein CkaCkLH20_12591 [Colletotrichum karsti]
MSDYRTYHASPANWFPVSYPEEMEWQPEPEIQLQPPAVAVPSNPSPLSSLLSLPPSLPSALSLSPPLSSFSISHPPSTNPFTTERLARESGDPMELDEELPVQPPATNKRGRGDGPRDSRKRARVTNSPPPSSFRKPHPSSNRNSPSSSFRNSSTSSNRNHPPSSFRNSSTSSNRNPPPSSFRNPSTSSYRNNNRNQRSSNKRNKRRDRLDADGDVEMASAPPPHKNRKGNQNPFARS